MHILETAKIKYFMCLQSKYTKEKETCFQISVNVQGPPFYCQRLTEHNILRHGRNLEEVKKW